MPAGSNWSPPQLPHSSLCLQSPDAAPTAPTARKHLASTANAASNEAATLLKQAADVMRKVTGMHLDVAVQGDVPNIRVTKVEGDVSSTPQTTATGVATVQVGDKSEDATFVFVDGHLYSDLGQSGSYTDFGSGASIYNVSVLLDPDKGLANLLTNLKNGSVAGSAAGERRRHHENHRKLRSERRRDACRYPPDRRKRLDRANYRLDGIGRVFPPRSDSDLPHLEHFGDSDHVRLGQAGHRNQTRLAPVLGKDFFHDDDDHPSAAG